MPCNLHQKSHQTNQPTRTLLTCLAALAVFTAAPSWAHCDADEVGYVASFAVKPGSEAGFEAALSTLAQTVNQVESGVVLYAPFRGTEGKYFMMERYVNEAARTAHGKAPEVAALFPGLGEFLAAAPVVNPVSAICP